MEEWMGVLGRYIDSLPDAARDRIIEAQDWSMGSLVDPTGSRCLLGHAEDWISDGSLFRNRARDKALQLLRHATFGPSSHLEIGSRFDRLCHRLGTEHMVRIIKLRAGRPHRPAARPSRAAVSAARRCFRG
jgi:hypothetical protein